ncbi:MAG: type II toxin-antitoxin system HicA family toxin [Acidobacteria bacterium]|nr:type II toxin-antitoxin system HicA family toxin [Acidobacteriota bacterium]MBI3658386.1 type II toxin-antitoxin system HicA family toxin [Acidobacteriota bacterium]
MSQKLPALKPKEVLPALRKAGFLIARITGSHYILKHPQQPALRVTIPMHNKDLKRGTLRSIIDQAGMTVDEFIKLI